MANVHVCVVVAVITLFSFIQIGAGIRCYICQSNLDRHCDDPFNASFTTRSNWGETPYFLTQDCSSLTTPTTFSSSMKAVCRKQVQISDAIRCFICQSDRDDNCHDPFNKGNSILLDCTLKYPTTPFQPNSCMKTIEYNQNSGVRHIVRSCGYQSSLVAPGKCEQPLHSNTIKTEFCELCNTDGCNSAPSLLSKNIFAHLLAFSFAAILGNYILF